MFEWVKKFTTISKQSLTSSPLQELAVTDHDPLALHLSITWAFVSVLPLVDELLACESPMIH